MEEKTEDEDEEEEEEEEVILSAPLFTASRLAIRRDALNVDDDDFLGGDIGACFSRFVDIVVCAQYVTHKMDFKKRRARAHAQRENCGFTTTDNLIVFKKKILLIDLGFFF